MHRIITAISCLFLVAACGSAPDFSGDYETSYMGQSVTLHLEQSASKLEGQITYGQMAGPLQATILADKASGHVDAGIMGRFPFEAEMHGEHGLRWKYLLALPGQNQALELKFERSAKSKNASTDHASNLDPAIVGRWRRTVSNTVVGTMPVDNMNLATDIFCTLSADGSFAYGGAMTGVASPGIAGTTGPAGTSNGQWKAKNNVLFTRLTGQEDWARLGRYAISGSSLVLHSSGKKLLWKRQ